MKKKLKKSLLSKLWAKVKELSAKVKSYVLGNHLALVNLAIGIALLLKMSKLEQMLMSVYMELAQGVGMTFFVLLQLASKLLGGEPA